MSSNSTAADDLCALDDRLCIAREYQKEIIVVPTLLVFFTLVTVVPLIVLKCCADRNRTRVKTPQRNYKSSQQQKHSNQHHHHHDHNNQNRHPNHHHNHHPHHNHHRPHHHNRHHLRGIDAPPGINPLEHEEVPMTVQPTRQNHRPTQAAPPLHTSRERPTRAPPPPQPQPSRDRPTRGPPPPYPSGERPHGALSFSQVRAMPTSFAVNNNDTFSLYRARMDNRNVVLRVLKESANGEEKQFFLGFASFVSGLGPHPFIPALLGVISVQPPLTVVMEELQHRDLLGFLWRCRQDNLGSDSCDMTEKRIYNMAIQVASALEYLHSQNCVHGNIGARSVLISADFTAKLWGLGPAYRRRTQAGSPGEVENMELRKWQAPEVLAMRPVTKSSDVWSFGILLYEMVTLGDPPFAQLMATELLQHLQRGNNIIRPATCSNSLYAILRSCCHFNHRHRTSVQELVRNLQAGERSANGRTVLRVPEPIILDRYLREAGYGEAYNYAVF
ncbi:tyrosine-protein kinase STYK1 isoform 1-T2 [Pholidichthys leucotaenia]